MGRKKRQKKKAEALANMEEYLREQERIYGSRLTSDGLPKPAAAGFSELLKEAKSKGRQKRRLIVVGFNEYEGQPRFEGGASVIQGGLPTLGKHR